MGVRKSTVKMVFSRAFNRHYFTIIQELGYNSLCQWRSLTAWNNEFPIKKYSEVAIQSILQVFGKHHHHLIHAILWDVILTRIISQKQTNRIIFYTKLIISNQLVIKNV